MEFEKLCNHVEEGRRFYGDLTVKIDRVKGLVDGKSLCPHYRAVEVAVEMCVVVFRSHSIAQLDLRGAS